MDGLQPIVSFGDLWVLGESERWKPRRRDFNLAARKGPCPRCGAKPGQPCTRQTERGPMPRQYSHVGRAAPMHSVVALNRGLLGDLE